MQRFVKSHELIVKKTCTNQRKGKRKEEEEDGDDEEEGAEEEEEKEEGEVTQRSSYIALDSTYSFKCSLVLV